MAIRKIVLTGAVSVGKTTTFDCVKRVFDIMNPMDRNVENPGPVVRFTGEAAREVLTEHPDLDRAAYETDRRIIERNITNEYLVSEQFPDTEVLVCDRSVLDSFVFARTHAGGHYDRLVQTTHLREYLHTYDKFLLFDPRNVPFVQEGIRVESLEFRNKLHQEFVTTLQEFGLDWELVTGPVSHRVLHVMEEVLRGEGL